MDLKNLWISILRRLEPTISRSAFLTWFQNTAVFELSEETLVVGCPTEIAREQLHRKFALKILQAASEIKKEIKEVEFAADAALADGSDPRTINLKAVFAKENETKIYRAAGRAEMKVTSEGIRAARLNPRYTLANFVPGEENRLAHAAALAVARTPGVSYNPLVIFGGVGLGKTHLLSAIGHEVMSNDPNRVVVMTNAEIFSREFISAARNQKAEEFKRRFRKADVLLFDDIQFLANRDKTQEAFFHIFNELHATGRQIVITSDRPPAELDLIDRLRSRCDWGLAAEIEQPNYHSRLDILRAKTSERRAVLDPALLEFIAMNVADSVRSLEGTLSWAVAQTELLKVQPTVREIGKHLQKMRKKDAMIGLPEHLEISVETPAEIISLVSEKLAIDETEIRGTSRKKEICTARQIAMFLSRKFLGCGLAEIATEFGRDAAGVLHSVRKIETSLTRDPALVRRVNSVKQKMGA